MSEYYLSIVVYGRGDDPNNRSHWAFALHRLNATLCILMQVLLIDRAKLIYQNETRSGVPLESRSSEGRFMIASLNTAHYTQATQIISQEPAPRNGVDRCQDWVLNCVISLEAEEIVPEGTSALIESLIGLPVVKLRERVRKKWTGNTTKNETW